MAIDFQAALDRKYDIQQQEATSRANLESAQAAGITASTPFENALKAAQARQTNASAATVAPLAQASIASTQAGIGETGARTGLLGAQTADINADLSPIGEAGSRLFLNQLRSGGAGNITTPAPAAPTSYQGASVVPPGGPGLAPVKSNLITTQGGAGAGRYDADGNYIQGFAFGTMNVQAPGQTVSNGSWTGPTPAAPPPAPLPPPVLTGADLRARLGYGTPKAYAKGTSRVPKGRMVSSPAMSAPDPMAPGSPGMAAGGLPGLAGILQAAMGARRVPGHLTPGVDSVPAMLSPGEAVVNPAAVKHIPGGRKTIEKANAKGAAEMQGRGAPPPPKSKAKSVPPPRSMGHFQPGQQQAAQAPAPKMLG